MATLRLTKNGAGEVLHDPMASKLVAHEIAHLLGAQHDGGFSQVKIDTVIGVQGSFYGVKWPQIKS